MFRKNSIFVKILIPIIIILILQPVLIGTVLFAYGIFNSLDDSAIESLSNNAENRSLILADKMVSAWSGLDRLELDVINILDDFLAEERLLLTNIIGNNAMETQILELLSAPLINALRQTTATGIFLFFGSDDAGEEAISLNGLYYHRPDPLITSPDNSDLMLLAGPQEIARKNRISTDSCWQGKFSFSPGQPHSWKAFTELQEIAKG